jgi:hypothetical protein
LQLRIIRNKTREWIAPPVDLAFGRKHRPIHNKRGGVHGFIRFLWWQRTGKSAVMTKETVGMFALEIQTS